MSNIVGLDVGQNGIKVVSIDKDAAGKLSLSLIGETKSPQMDGNTDGSKDKYFKELSQSLKTLILDLKIKGKQVVVNLPENEVVSRLVRLPPLKDSEIMDALKFEAETFVPYPLDKVSIDYEVVEKDDAGRITVFVIAAKNDLISEYVKMFKSLGMELIAIESSSVAYRRMIRSGVISVERVIVLDIGEKYSDILNINKGNVYFSRSLPVGGESITRAISLGLGLDMPSAEEYKKAYGIKAEELEGKIRTVALPVFNSIADEVRKAMTLFSEDTGKTIELLVLVGGGAVLPGMAEELTKVLGVEVQVAQPFVKIETNKIQTPFNLATEGSRFSLAVGLSLRGLV
jgi:type IV pilus assembly protein PilM